MTLTETVELFRESLSPLTPEERREWIYRFEERCAIICGTAEPTDEQMEIARQEADKAILEMRGGAS